MLPERQRRFAAGLQGGEIPASDFAGQVERFGIYRNNGLLSLGKVLRQVFPATERMLGKDEFERISRDFIGKNPPEAPDLALFGKKLPEYLHEIDQPEEIIELAALEWLYASLPEHEYAPELSLQSGVPAGIDPLQISFVWHPAAELFSPAFAIDRLLEGETEIHCEQRYLLLRARNGRIEQRVLDAETFSFYQALYLGKTLGQAVEWISLGNIDIIATLAQALAFGCFAEMRI